MFERKKLFFSRMEASRKDPLVDEGAGCTRV